MRIFSKWLLSYIAASILVFMTGWFYYQTFFRVSFQDKMKQDVIEMVRLKAPDLIKGLLRSPTAVTFEEFDIMNWLSSDKRIASLVFLNYNGSVRWHKYAPYMTLEFDEYEKKIGTTLQTVRTAYSTGEPAIADLTGSLCEISIPFKANNNNTVIGILSLQVSTETADKMIGESMMRYTYATVAMLLLIGLLMALFQNHVVVAPIAAMKESVENISMKTMDLRPSGRRDELGALSLALAQFVDKVRKEFHSVQEREARRAQSEQLWWQVVLGAAVSKRSRAMVVDEDNNVLYANFEINRGPSPNGKVHLLDVIDSQQQDVLRLIGLAMETPQQVVEGEVMFNGGKAAVRVIEVQTQDNLKRTMITMEPRA